VTFGIEAFEEVPGAGDVAMDVGADVGTEDSAAAAATSKPLLGTTAKTGKTRSSSAAHARRSGNVGLFIYYLADFVALAVSPSWTKRRIASARVGKSGSCRRHSSMARSSDAVIIRCTRVECFSPVSLMRP
jgi:hypothetical protein